MRDHWWWRPGWRLGRRAYTFHITFDDASCVEGAPDLRRLSAAYQDQLASLPGMDLVPLEWLHLTMQNVGFTDEVGDQEIHHILEEARVQCSSLPTFELAFGPVEIRTEAIALRPSPIEPVAALRHSLTAAIASVLGENAVPLAPEHVSGYEPHVSVAYSNTDIPTEPIAEALSSMTPAPATVMVRAASLISLDRDQRIYRWRRYGEVPLAKRGSEAHADSAEGVRDAGQRRRSIDPAP